jgi:antitoxin ParD1/3/4
MNISLGAHFERFVAEILASGRYASQSEVVREGLRLLEEREARLSHLRHELEAGRASGDPVAYDPEEIKRRGREALKAR